MNDDHDTRDNSLQTIPIHLIEPDGECIRKSDTDIAGLKYTISDVGLLQPIIVRKTGDKYTVIDGHRRLRALRELAVADLIVGREVIVNVNEKEADNRFRQIIANIQREDIGDIELGHAFVTLKEVYGYQYNEIAEVIGKNRHYVTAKVGLAKRLAVDVQELVAYDLETAKDLNGACDGEDDADHYVMNMNIIEAIARLPPDLQMDAYTRVKAGEMNKEEAFELIRSLRKGESSKAEPGSVSGDFDRHAGLYRYVKKVDKDLDLLATRLKSDDAGEQEKILPAIESIIERLSLLRSEIKGKAYLPEKDEFKVSIP